MPITIGLFTLFAKVRGMLEMDWTIENITTDAKYAIHITKGIMIISQDLEYTIQHR